MKVRCSVVKKYASWVLWVWTADLLGSSHTAVSRVYSRWCEKTARCNMDGAQQLSQVRPAN